MRGTRAPYNFHKLHQMESGVRWPNNIRRLIHNRFSSHTIIGMAVLSSSFSSVRRVRCECATSCPMFIFYLRQLYESDPRQATDAHRAPLASDGLQFFLSPFRSTCVIRLIAVAYKHYSELPQTHRSGATLLSDGRPFYCAGTLGAVNFAAHNNMHDGVMAHSSQMA